MAMRTFTDMMNREVIINFPPKRIISLVPSQTELLFDLGLGEEVVGITKFCVHPNEWFRNKKRVGGTKTINIATVRSLNPDLIIANKEENTKEQIEQLSVHYSVWISNIQTVRDALQMIEEVGHITGKTAPADKLLKDIDQGFNSLRAAGKSRRVAYFIWRNPWMSVGGDTFINDMIEKIGWQNVLADKQRYPEISLSELIDKNVELVLLSSEPYPFKDIHIAEIEAVLPGVEVMLVDGEMFSWYGSRMKQALPYLSVLVKKRSQ